MKKEIQNLDFLLFLKHWALEDKACSEATFFESSCAPQ